MCVIGLENIENTTAAVCDFKILPAHALVSDLNPNQVRCSWNWFFVPCTLQTLLVIFNLITISANCTFFHFASLPSNCYFFCLIAENNSANVNMHISLLYINAHLSWCVLANYWPCMSNLWSSIRYFLMLLIMAFFAIWVLITTALTWSKPCNSLRRFWFAVVLV